VIYMVTMMEIQLLVITGMVLIVILFFAYSFTRDQATENKRLVRIPVKTRDQRGRSTLPEEESSEVSPTVYYIGFLFIAYLLAMLLMAI
jgi:hypothetical protein